MRDDTAAVYEAMNWVLGMREGQKKNIAAESIEQLVGVLREGDVGWLPRRFSHLDRYIEQLAWQTGLLDVARKEVRAGRRGLWSDRDERAEPAYSHVRGVDAGNIHGGRRDAMRMRGCPRTMWVVPLALAALTLPGLGTGSANAEAPGMAGPVQELTFVIKDRSHGYELSKGTAMAGSLMKITVRNEDSVTHGFTSNLFQNLPVKLEGQGKEVKGKKIRSFHLDPGQAMTLTFAKPSDVQRDGLYGGNEAYTQYHTIWCDIHPEVRGELLIVETSGVPGGG